MSPRHIRIDDVVSVEQNALIGKMPPEKNSRKAIQETLCDTYYITGVGRTCYGIRNKENTWRFNVRHDCVIKCGQSNSAD